MLTLDPFGGAGCEACMVGHDVFLKLIQNVNSWSYLIISLICPQGEACGCSRVYNNGIKRPKR